MKINIAINLLYRLEPIGALIQRKACSALYGNLFVFSPFWSPSRMAGFILCRMKCRDRFLRSSKPINGAEAVAALGWMVSQPN